MVETEAEKVARLEKELAAARFNLLLSRQEADVCRAKAQNAERDETTLGSLLREIAVLTKFPDQKPVSHLPSHIRALVSQQAA